MMDSFILEELLKSALPMMSSSSSSSDDEAYHQVIKREKKQKIVNYVEEIVQGYTEMQFKEHFRMERTTVADLINSYSTSMYKRTYQGGRPMTDAQKAMLMTIWYLANCETFRQIADRFGVSLSTAHINITKICEYFVQQSHLHIVWPDVNRAHTESLCFARKKGMANVIGAIDGSHIRINRPSEHEEDFVNRKGYHSILMQGTVDSKLLFIDVLVGLPGSVHDARMLRKSILYKTAADTPDTIFYNKYHLLGDSAYPTLEWLVPPFKDNGHLSQEERDFNYRHAATRMVIENAFGLLKGRFRRLQKFDNQLMPFIVNCVITACVLHNICIREKDACEETYND